MASTVELSDTTADRIFVEALASIDDPSDTDATALVWAIREKRLSSAQIDLYIASACKAATMSRMQSPRRQEYWQ